MEAFVLTRTNPDVIGVKKWEKWPACSPSSFRRKPPDGIGAGPPFVTRAIVAEKLASLGSGFRRNDARDVIFAVGIIPKTRN